ncbi:invasion associated locus B family protein [Agrobacterium pusense]|uniref:Invasion associated locus B family protein n=3 Tax=Hyphomicrobiales TaxID=356 RepID=A0AA44IXU3_9HYPH|nr:invasion associated locus B family protein [Agrobacterium sp. S2]MBW9059658.1 invasion associated locus B family protein [Agrobacterium pusense]MDP9771571.1 invasion protein IalB [Rhizobium sp. SORGH_AS_0755]QBJ16374.1 invasion associated locus B family protein [Agrobacterium sp. 33MFTa1.1]CUW98084.1 Invasion protein B, involved in pathogenesis [Agrobacterium genomosp. 2 str. CFBP 5494]
MQCKKTRCASAMAATLLFVASSLDSAAAQETSQGAVSFHEAHGSWQLACAGPENNDEPDRASGATQEIKRTCAIAQVQLEEKTRKLAVSVEFRLAGEKAPGKLAGTMVLPFGLAVTKLFSVKSGNMRLQEVQVSTCLPVGCVVSFSPFVELVSALKAEQTLTIEAPDLQGRIVSFQLQGKGFPEALKRLEEVR